MSYAVEDTIDAEVRPLREQLNDDLFFTDQITELTYQLMWPFNWHEREEIKLRAHEILHANRIP